MLYLYSTKRKDEWVAQIFYHIFKKKRNYGNLFFSIFIICLIPFWEIKYTNKINKTGNINDIYKDQFNKNKYYNLNNNNIEEDDNEYYDDNNNNDCFNNLFQLFFSFL